MADAMTPFADDQATVQVGGIMVENGTERISISGSVGLARDRQALEHAMALRSVLDRIIGVLEGDHALPAQAPESKLATTTTAKNPFV